MVIVTLQRAKCIGCNYCVEMAPKHFQMSTKDGKSVLLKSTNNKGFFTLKTNNTNILEVVEAAEKACPVKIISVKLTG
ncbi:MAG: ferredoxin [Flavobacteriaceae bacterium CG_4_8_14_3_um_filter_34_10]|nr:ferredoxin [Flavobacteriia bacterium]OIP51757.1 MAG: 4Fe-4S ferredoxin [Flavobacteriaceae bacterium CG2_30_34_30]PIQ19547.1 MAG: 4Fe-4S ferredoxin [Flavobacteriaceae bacterium CG18_big_fil_WC_8_21_14_2_50_34_36]PIV49522.1 MAG: ferredoxin [Flavobacteriaceae bacterium CG02_land_8_20_14_3_00_34_13]PIX09473.1 MAG: ferredoxin [Flavobacteriaceae bacterium CG_4_8_14_3_um_filter_34_10]PIZ09144.1 MAG: ferredoxin [Flavobacteriaceae bacterium CG_4_10_14_0_8_um_filter_34_31]PJC07522.1 MAG: ferredoxin 